MGFLRGALVSVIGVALLVSLFVMNASLTLTWSLEYETLKPVLKDTVMNYAEDNFDLDIYLDDAIDVMQAYCVDETEFVFNQGGFTFVVPCDVISQGSSAVLDYGVGTLIEDIYYADYDCEFWQCVKKADTLLVLISEKSHDYWQSKFYIFLLTSIGLFMLMFIVANKKSNAFIFGGLLVIISSLPFIKLSWISMFLPESIRSIFLDFFARSHNVFLIMLIIGGFLLGLGIVFHFLKWGLKISNLFRKDSGEDNESEEDEDVSKEDVKKIIKKEIAKHEIKEVVQKELSKDKSKSKVVAKKPAKSFQPAKSPIKSTSSLKTVMKSNKK